ncbi:DNA polymerase III subunit epsilon [Bordetella genomosp. 13]|uniref:DNA polymerase III subunit epsilon n=1 Tax=Bordetella genomosp. 13 TaxID=463040 RepID=UPI0011A441D1|nr:DNA polymerase III subunit epsilon [Bordetella genomosp. 13]
MRQIVFDTETTGLDPAQGHRIIEIGCVEVINRTVTGRNLHIYLNPDRDSDPEALAVHGLTTEFLADKPRFPEVAEQFIEFIQGAELIAHNASFDVKFFNAELAKVGRGPMTEHCEVITDSLMHARSLFPGKRNSLDALCDRFGISNAHRTLHGALLDSQLLAEVWLAMTRGQDALLIDADDGQQGAGGGMVLGTFDASVLQVIVASTEELAAHEAYLQDLDKAVKGACVWRQLEQPPAAEAEAAA